MEYIKLGNTGLTVSRITLGTMSYGGPTQLWPWALNENDSRPFIKKALELGINFFDSADTYNEGHSEEVLGRALKDFGRREEQIIASKVYYPVNPKAGPNEKGLSRKHIMTSIDKSLKRLGTDYIDLYQIHRYDSYTPIEETMEALHDIVKAGKARYIGASSMLAWQFAKAQYTAELNGWTKFVSMQPQYNLVYREEEREVIPFCLDQKVAILPWSPLAAGLLAGSWTREGKYTERAKSDPNIDSFYDKDNDFDIAERVILLADKKGISAAQVALAWVLSKPGITSLVIGATEFTHLDDAVASLSVKLSEEEVNFLEEIYELHPVKINQ